LKSTSRPQCPPPEALSESELQILRLVLDGRTTREIAGTLSRSTRTIESHRHNIMRKLGVKNIAQLVQRATDTGLNDRTPVRFDDTGPARNPTAE
jgi:DNA-binding NarL/FixJ family response regulator